ncbi:MAG: iron-containing alcohol dehydrogenase [Myxococcales bacterium]|nr:iron-containing alcohol dehydrogenase [Myxococcales bacterium]
MLSDNVFEIRPGVRTHFGCGSVERLARACEARYAQLAIALGVAAPGVSDAENAIRATNEVERLSMRLGTARTATALGVVRERVPTRVEDAMADFALSGTPRFPDANDVLALYEAAL